MIVRLLAVAAFLAGLWLTGTVRGPGAFGVAEVRVRDGSAPARPLRAREPRPRHRRRAASSGASRWPRCAIAASRCTAAPAAPTAGDRGRRLARGRPARPAAPAELVRAARPTHLLHLAWTTEHGRFWTDPANLDWVAATRRSSRRSPPPAASASCSPGPARSTTGAATSRSRRRGRPRRPATLYGRAKQATEDWLAGAGLSWATGLLFLPYGPFDEPGRLVPSVRAACWRARRRGRRTVSRCATSSTSTTAAARWPRCSRSRCRARSTSAPAAAPRSPRSRRTVARLVGREDLLRVGALPGDDGPHARRRRRARACATRSASCRATTSRPGLRDDGRVVALSARGAGSRPARRSAAAWR